jgi:hypothetical protein
MKKLLLGFQFLLVIFLTSCSFERACTTEFRFITLRVEDETGQPVNSVKVTVTLGRTGEILDMGREQSNGTYLIADDSLREKFSSDKDVLAVTGSKDNKGFQAQLELRNNGCHIEKISGPEIVTLK